MAVSACEDGAADNRNEARNRRVRRRRVSNEDAESACVSRSVGNSLGAVMSLPPFAAMINPEELAKHYTRFRVTERILLTGHSHQAWPDVAFEAQQQAWLDTAEFVDDVWDKAFEKANDVRRGFARLMDDSADNIALAPNTHELVVRFLSALPLKKRPKLITTDGGVRPVLNGWLSDLGESLKAPSGRVEYGRRPARFAGATYQFTSHYRGAELFKFFEHQKLTPQKLRALSQHQMELLSGGT